jgi:hypothetical protein
MNTETGLCVGCYRTIEEIAGWTVMSHERRLEVLDAVAERRSADGRDPD